MDQPFCQQCGLPVANGDAGCHSLFKETLRNFYEHADWMAYVKPLIYSYSLQHPQSGLKTPRSFAECLVGICLWLDYPDDKSWMKAHRIWIDGAIQLASPPAPVHKGILSISHVHQAKDLEDMKKRLRDYATSVRDAYSEHKELIQTWLVIVESLKQ